MKVLFLDIDGVLNHVNTPRKFGRALLPCDPTCVTQLNRITRETGAYIVISSSWRYLYSSMEDMWADLNDEQGIEGSVIGMLRRQDWDRGELILDWIKTADPHQKNSIQFVVLDDDIADMGAVQGQLVRTSFRDNGLTPELANEVIARFKSLEE